VKQLCHSYTLMVNILVIAMQWLLTLTVNNLFANLALNLVINRLRKAL
jgi:hypothetical protein